MKVIVTYRNKKPGISMRISKEGEIRVSASLGISRAEVERFISDHKEWIDRAFEKMAASRERRDNFHDRLPLQTRQQCEEASRRLNVIIPPLVEKHAARMKVRPLRVSYSAAKTRWGSCNTRKRYLNFSAYLLLLPDWCIEHVVVHELAHLIVPNHSAEFYKVMDTYFPRWKEARQETKRLSNLEIPD